MNNKELNIWKLAALVLLLCNLGLIAGIWWSQTHHAPMHGTPRENLIEAVNFTPEQIKKYDVLIPKHQQAMRTFRQEAKEYRQFLYGNMAAPLGPHQLDSIYGLIAKTQYQIESVTFQHFQEVRTICQPNQLAAFDKAIIPLIFMMNGRPPHPPHGAPPPPPQREP